MAPNLQLVMQQTQPSSKRLIAASVRWGHRQAGAVGVLESTIDKLRAELAVFRERVSRLSDQVGDDAPHWLLAAAEGAESFDALLGNCMCEHHDDRLATWLHPEHCGEKYCGACAKQFATCEVCGQWMPLADQISLDGVTGHEACMGGER